MRTHNPFDRAKDAFRKAVTRAQVDSREAATLGWRKSATEVILQPPGRVNYLYITVGGTVAIALNRAGVPLQPFLPVWVVLENNTYVVISRNNADAGLLVNVPDGEYGGTPHPLGSHSDVLLTSLADGEMLEWDATAGKWVNVVASGDVGAAINAAAADTPLDADKFGFWDVVDSALKSITWASFRGLFITFTNKIAIAATATTGAALRVARDLAAASTDSPVVDIVQDNAGDDQAALRIQQDGTGAVVEAYDGATLVLRARDGGILDVYNILRALTSSGLRLEEDSGIAGWIIKDGGNVESYGGPNATVGDVLVDSANKTVYVGRLSATSGDQTAFIVRGRTGGVLLSADANLGTVAIGKSVANFALDVKGNLNVDPEADGGSLSFRTPEALNNLAVMRFATQGTGISSAEVIADMYAIITQATPSALKGELHIRTNRGDSVQDTMVLTDAGNVGIGVATPQGRLHVHDGTGGKLFVSKTGIVGSEVTIIPDGTGDVTKMVIVHDGVYSASDGSVGVLGTIAISTPGAGSTTSVTGALTFKLYSTGQLVVYRSFGAATWALTFSVVWQ